MALKNLLAIRPQVFCFWRTINDKTVLNLHRYFVNIVLKDQK